MSNSKRKEDNIKMNGFSIDGFRQEAEHTAMMIRSITHDFLENHHYYFNKINPTFNAAVDDAIRALERAYQAVDEDYETVKAVGFYLTEKQAADMLAAQNIGIDQFINPESIQTIDQQISEAIANHIQKESIDDIPPSRLESLHIPDVNPVVGVILPYEKKSTRHKPVLTPITNKGQPKEATAKDMNSADQLEKEQAIIRLAQERGLVLDPLLIIKPDDIQPPMPDTETAAEPAPVEAVRAEVEAVTKVEQEEPEPAIDPEPVEAVQAEAEAITEVKPEEPEPATDPEPVEAVQAKAEAVIEVEQEEPEPATDLEPVEAVQAEAEAITEVKPEEPEPATDPEPVEAVQAKAEAVIEVEQEEPEPATDLEPVEAVQAEAEAITEVKPEEPEPATDLEPVEAVQAEAEAITEVKPEEPEPATDPEPVEAVQAKAEAVIEVEQEEPEPATDPEPVEAVQAEVEVEQKPEEPEPAKVNSSPILLDASAPPVTSHTTPAKPATQKPETAFKTPAESLKSPAEIESWLKSLVDTRFDLQEFIQATTLDEEWNDQIMMDTFFKNEASISTLEKIRTTNELKKLNILCLRHYFYDTQHNERWAITDEEFHIISENHYRNFLHPKTKEPVNPEITKDCILAKLSYTDWYLDLIKHIKR